MDFIVCWRYESKIKNLVFESSTQMVIVFSSAKTLYPVTNHRLLAQTFTIF
jgi:hypothetical protein